MAVTIWAACPLAYEQLSQALPCLLCLDGLVDASKAYLQWSIQLKSQILLTALTRLQVSLLSPYLQKGKRSEVFSGSDITEVTVSMCARAYTYPPTHTHTHTHRGWMCQNGHQNNA